MRIAIYHNLPSGGGKRALSEMTRRLAGRHEVDVYTLSCAEHSFCDLRAHCRRHTVYPFSPLRLMRSPLGRLNQAIRTVDLLRLRALQRRIALHIDSAKYDVVFVHQCRYGNAPSVLQFLVTPSVYYCGEPPRHIHEPQIARPYRASSRQKLMDQVDPLPTLYRRVLARLDRASVRSACMVMANSAYSRESLYRAYGVFARVSYLGVDTQLFRPLSLPKSEFVMSVGALGPHKGFDFLVRSLALVDAPCRPPLIIVSNAVDGDEHRYLQELAGQQGVHVAFRTLVPDEQLVALYNQALLTLYAPVMEPFGFVPLESMACGTPVVGVREAGVRETVLHEETGVLTERDPSDFAGAVRELLDDDVGRMRLGERGRSYVERRWQWEEAVRILEQDLESASHQSKHVGR